MELGTIIQDIESIISEIHPHMILPEKGVDLMSPQQGILPRDMVFIFKKLTTLYNVNINKLVDSIGIYSIEEIAQAIFMQDECCC